MADETNRGKVQAQGPKVDETVRWGQDAPPPAARGHAMLEELRNKLERREQDYREQAFFQAHEAVNKAAAVGGIPQDGRYPASKSYPQPPLKDGRRVDVEVYAGKAFVADRRDAAAGGG